MTNDKFEWNDEKARANLQKHGVSFDDACVAFSDVFFVERQDDRSVHDEERYIITGLVHNILLSVVYTERNGRIRIISARKTSRREQDDDYRNQTAY